MWWLWWRRDLLVGYYQYDSISSNRTSENTRGVPSRIWMLHAQCEDVDSLSSHKTIAWDTCATLCFFSINMFLLLLGKLEVFETEVSLKSFDDESVPTLRVKLPQPELFRSALPKVTAKRRMRRQPKRRPVGRVQRVSTARHPLIWLSRESRCNRLPISCPCNRRASCKLDASSLIQVDWWISQGSHMCATWMHALWGAAECERRPSNHAKAKVLRDCTNIPRIS